MPSNKILIVEDSPIVGLHLRNVLEKANYLVMAIVTSGEEAIDFIRDHSPGLILMDVNLEGPYDGIETSIEVNKIKDIPVIYLTAADDPETFQRAKITFPYSFITKPFSETELLANVELTLYKHKYEQEQKEAQDLLSTILAKTKSAVVVVDDSNRVQYINQFLADLLKTPADQLIGIALDEEVKLATLNNEEISFGKFSKERALDLSENNILKLIYKEKTYPITNVFITRAKFLKTEGQQFLIMFTDARKKLSRVKAAKLRRQQRLNAQMTGIENERARVSRDLHDGLGQLLNVIKMKVKNLGEDISAEKEGILKLINQTIEETSKISNDLMPSKLRDFDLQTCLASLCNDFRGAGVEVSFNSNLKAKELDQHKINIFRIIQESFNNSFKHAKATLISLQIYKERSNVRICIEDDGIGFNVEEVKKRMTNKSHGLSNMLDRVNAMQGEIEFNSDSNFGTSIIIHFKENKNAQSFIS